MTNPSLDPDVQAIAEDGRAASLPEWHKLSISEARRVEAETFGAGGGPEMETIENRTVPGPVDEVPVRIYHPDVAGDAPLPVIVFCHGGGWVMGTLDSADDICRTLADRSGAIVVSVDYRLAPEAPFPAALDDAEAALSWTVDNAAELGGIPHRLVVAGTSAGGGLAAGLALRSRNRGPTISAQLLLYPMLAPPGSKTIPDHDAIAAAVAKSGGPFLSTESVEWFWEQYLQGDDPTDAAAPLTAMSLSGRPPAVIATGGHDVLALEGLAYGERLQSLGIESITRHYPRLPHGFLSFVEAVGRADEAATEITDSLCSLL